MRISGNHLNSIACFLVGIFFIVTLNCDISGGHSESSFNGKITPKYWEGVPLSEMGLELVPLSDPVQVSDGPSVKFVQSVGVRGGFEGTPYSVHVMWSEPTEDEGREIVERYGPVDGSDFSEKRFVTKPDGHQSYSPSMMNGVHYLYLGYMDQKVNTREIWFQATDGTGWTEPELVSDRDVDSRSWGSKLMPFFEEKTGYELPVLLWFDHRFTAHELLFKSRMKGVDFLGPGKGGFVLEKSDWHPYNRITFDDYYQFEPNTGWSSGYGSLQDNVIHLAYMDSRYSGEVLESKQRDHNCEIHYRNIRPIAPLIKRDEQGRVVPAEQKWEIGEEVRLTFNPWLSDYPSICGKRYLGNTDFESAMVVWHEVDREAQTREIHFCTIDNNKPGEIRIISQPGYDAACQNIESTPIKRHEGMAAVVYNQYGKDQSFPSGNAGIYLRIIDGNKISEPIQISDATYTCGFAGINRVGYGLEDEVVILTSWSEYRGGHLDLSGENQVFFRSFTIRPILD